MNDYQQFQEVRQLSRQDFFSRVMGYLAAGLGLSAAGVLIFTVSLQPYAAAFMFVFLLIKALMLIKWA